MSKCDREGGCTWPECPLDCPGRTPEHQHDAEGYWVDMTCVAFPHEKEFNPVTGAWRHRARGEEAWVDGHPTVDAEEAGDEDPVR